MYARMRRLTSVYAITAICQLDRRDQTWIRPNMGACGLPSMRERKSGTLKPTMSAEGKIRRTGRMYEEGKQNFMLYDMLMRYGIREKFNYI